METRNRLTVTRGERGGGERRKKGEEQPRNTNRGLKGTENGEGD